MKKIELLAPAGSMESLISAVNNGADAVYLGGSKFSARAYASNFDNDKMKEAVDYCHSYDVMVYVTMNTLLKEIELKEAIKYVGYLYEIGVDALIIQDLGLVSLIKAKYPRFEIHASTQMTIHNAEGALYFKNKGFKRIVVSRELSIDEIRYIAKDLEIETEMFIHGALCVCYSGKCLMSSLIGGRSGNRGRCAQPCRMEYTLEDKNGRRKSGYLLSPKDMCMVDDIREIIESRAYSLKIEGRMKRPEYVAGVVNNYRKALDKELLNYKFDIAESKRSLMQLFNRSGFSNAYLRKNNGKDMMSYNYAKNTGVDIGTVLSDGSIVLKEDIQVGDGIRYKDEGFTLSKIILNNNEVKEAKRGDMVKLFPKGYKKGDVLYRTSSKALFDSLSETIKPYYKKILLKGSLDFKLGEKLCLKVNYNGKEFVSYGDEVQKALKSPISKDRIISSLEKTDCQFKLHEIYFNSFDEGFVTVSSLNALRRQIFDDITKYQVSKDRRKRDKEEIEEYKSIKQTKNIGYIYTCSTREQLRALRELEVDNIAVDIFRRDKDKIREEDIKDVYLLLPEIIKGEFNKIIQVIERIKNNIKGIITSNAGIIKRYKDELYIIGDYKLNVFNSKALEFYREDIDMVSLSVELNKKEIKDIVKSKIDGICLNIYGKAEAMVSEYCPIGCVFGGKSKNNECKGECLKSEYTLIDRKNQRFRVITDDFCRSHILNSVPTYLFDEVEELKKIGINNFRVDFKDESYDEVKKVVNMLINKTEFNGELYTKGHYRRGVE